MLGTYFGAWSSLFVSGAFQLAVFAAVMLAASILMLKPIDCERNQGKQRSPAHITMDGLIVGWVTGFVGVGGGFLIVPALVLLGGLSMHRAVATSLVVISLKSAVGFVKYVDVLATQNLSIDMNIILVISLFGIAGSMLGSRVGKNVSTEKLKQVFGIFLIVMGTYVLSTSIPDLLST